MAFLHEIINRKEAEISAAKQCRSIGDLRRMITDAPPLRSFSSSLNEGFGLIAEIKRKSPSAGSMRSENVEQAAAAYNRSAIVKAVSVLTNGPDFGMSIDDLSQTRQAVRQPILRKDFIFQEYQIYEARAFGADAILLMSNLVDRDKLRRLFNLASELGLEVLCEANTRKEIESIPDGARIYGINSRKFMASKRWRLTKMLVRMQSNFGWWWSAHGPDPSVTLQAFSLIQHLPAAAIKVAESGVKPGRVAEIRDLGYNAVLVGTSLLKAPEGIYNMLREFEDALSGKQAKESAIHRQVSVPA
jgi:indole-3-glycerol phosphate synthase